MQFHKKVKENEALNQYWYSKQTVDSMLVELFLLAQASDHTLKVAFLSTPSLYFCLDSAWKQHSNGSGTTMPIDPVLFDFDESLGQKTEPNSFHLYDFRKPDALPESMLKSFDCVVIDPPFITEEVWRAYATTSDLLLSNKKRLFIGTSVLENAALLYSLFQANPTPFQPSIPTLVYQYTLFANFTPQGPLSLTNLEIPNN